MHFMLNRCVLRACIMYECTICTFAMDCLHARTALTQPTDSTDCHSPITSHVWNYTNLFAAKLLSVIIVDCYCRHGRKRARERKRVSERETEMASRVWLFLAFEHWYSISRHSSTNFAVIYIFYLLLMLLFRGQRNRICNSNIQSNLILHCKWLACQQQLCTRIGRRRAVNDCGV